MLVGKNGPKLETAKTPAEPGHRGINVNPGVMTAREGAMSDFADVLTTNLDRPVLDRTNLNGSYDFTLTWDPPPAPANGQSWSPIGPSLVMAIRDSIRKWPRSRCSSSIRSNIQPIIELRPDQRAIGGQRLRRRCADGSERFVTTNFHAGHGNAGRHLSQKRQLEQRLRSEPKRDLTSCLRARLCRISALPME
jgi:hypothetical protein